MNKLALSILLGMVSLLTFGQTNEKELSNVESFSAKSGTLMKKEYFEVGVLKKCEIKVIHFIDLITDTKQAGLKFEYDVASSYSTDTKSAILDVDEIDALMSSIRLMQENILVTAPENYTEVAYRSRSGFQCGCYYSKGAWSTFMKLEKFDSKSYVWLTADDMPQLYSLLEKAKTLL